MMNCANCKNIDIDNCKCLADAPFVWGFVIDGCGKWEKGEDRMGSNRKEAQRLYKKGGTTNDPWVSDILSDMERDDDHRFDEPEFRRDIV